MFGLIAGRKHALKYLCLNLISTIHLLITEIQVSRLSHVRLAYAVALPFILLSYLVLYCTYLDTWVQASQLFGRRDAWPPSAAPKSGTRASENLQ
jgi:hypothetical protein